MVEKVDTKCKISMHGTKNDERYPKLEQNNSSLPSPKYIHWDIPGKIEAQGLLYNKQCRLDLADGVAFMEGADVQRARI
jgi:hypothetical protein